MTKVDKDYKVEMLVLLEKDLTILTVCKRLNLARQTVYRWMKDDKEFAVAVKEAIKNAVLDVNDDCENRLLAKIRADDSQMIKFWLKSHHPDYKQQYIVAR